MRRPRSVGSGGELAVGVVASGWAPEPVLRANSSELEVRSWRTDPAGGCRTPVIDGLARGGGAPPDVRSGERAQHPRGVAVGGGARAARAGSAVRAGRAAAGVATVANVSPPLPLPVRESDGRCFFPGGLAPGCCTSASACACTCMCAPLPLRCSLASLCSLISRFCSYICCSSLATQRASLAICKARLTAAAAASAVQ